MNVSNKMKERFCRDCNIPIKIFDEANFQVRLKLFDPYFGCVSLYKRFLNAVSKYPTEQDYLEEYNRVKDEAINFIKNTPEYQEFNEMDMNKFSVPVEYRSLPGKDIFKPSNDKCVFISIDIRKANFSALHQYNVEIFGGAASWEEFISKFTDNEHIISSKYIRQVVMGNCNPKRHITYEKYLMSGVIPKILSVVKLEDIAFFSNDEIVIKLGNIMFERTEEYEKVLVDNLTQILSGYVVPLKVERFVLHKISGINGYIKEIEDTHKLEFKCIDSIMFPFVIKALEGRAVSLDDMVFIHESTGLLSRFLEVPDISIDLRK